MGFFDDLKTAVYAEMPRKIECNRSITIEELYELLQQHADEFPVPFKLTGFLGKHITFAREPKLEMQIWVMVKDNVITVRPNSQEVEYETEGFAVSSVFLKNLESGLLGAELNRDTYINYVTETITRIVNG